MASKIKYIFIILVVVLFSMNAHALSAIAFVDGYIHQTFFISYNNLNQKDADANAIKGCRKNLQESEEKIKDACKVYGRPKEPGFGAFACGEKGCAWTYSYTERQAAVDTAHDECEKRNYKNCQTENIFNWGDFQGFKKEMPISNNANCRPKTNTIRCQSSCTNGDCLIIYENGCKIRVQVDPKYDSFQNRWTYPAPSC